MPTRTRIAAVLAALAAIAAIPAVADAATVPMRGVVSGSPYGASGGQMAIPVLFSKQTARTAGLKSPVGVIIVKRTAKVTLPAGAGSTLPVNLRTGDRFKGTGVVGAVQKRVFYPRVVFSQTAVYFRSKELSLAELSAAVDGLGKALAALKAATAAGFQDVYAQLADLRKQLAALAALKLPDFQAQIDALTKSLNDLIAGLPDFSKFALVSQLPDLTSYVTLTNLTNTLAAYATKAYVDGQINAIKAMLPAGVVAGTATLPTTADLTAAVSGLASTTYVDNAVAPVKAKVNELATAYSSLCTTLKTFVALPGLTCSGVTPLP
jgi:hypothetical protein